MPGEFFKSRSAPPQEDWFTPWYAQIVIESLGGHASARMLAKMRRDGTGPEYFVYGTPERPVYYYPMSGLEEWTKEHQRQNFE
jgi:hypothetical protein